MHGPALRIPRRPTRRDEQGVVAIMVALCMTLLCVVTAMVLDFGLVKIDRQVHKSDADGAVLAGLRSMDFTGSNTARPYLGVCTALRFLKASDVRFSGLSEASGWSDGTGSAKTNGCTDTTLLATACTSASKDTWAQYDASSTYRGLSYTVHIQNGYDFSDSSSWSEDALPASTGTGTDKCMDMELTISESRKPGLGSLATSANLRTAIRTVGRVNSSPGGYAPAMLLIKRTGCPADPLQLGGANTFIHVLGFASSTDSQPGTIHSDSDGLNGCASNGGKQILNGAGIAGGIVAYAAPLIGNPTSPDPTKPGQITSVATQNGVASSIVRDDPNAVYGATGLNAGAPGTPTEVGPRSVVTRQPVDFRYKASVASIISNSTGYWGLSFNQNQAHNANYGYASCNNSGAINAAQIDAYIPSYFNGLFVDCPQVTSIPSAVISGYPKVIFRGSVKLSGGLSLPDTSAVYIGGDTPGTNNPLGLSLSGNAATFQMHTTSRLDPVAGFADGFRCKSTRTGSRGLLVVRNGNISLSSGSSLFRACDTTVVMIGNNGSGALQDNTGCVPTYDPLSLSLAPTSYPTHSPCTSANAGGTGTGQVDIGGTVDWTAPNECDVIKLGICDGGGFVDSPGGWGDVKGPEDLALWSESAAFGSTNARIGGAAAFNLRGVFMTPNFDPLNLGGGPSTTLTNAQFIASALNLNGGAQLTMSVDPNSAVQLNRLQLVGLMR